MSKFSKMLIMTKLLEEGNIISTKKLSEVLGVGERMVRKYAEDIKAAGVHIESKTGSNGGYYIESQFLKKKLDIEKAVKVELAKSKEEWDVCINGTWYVKTYNFNENDLVQLYNRIQNDFEALEDINKWNSHETEYDKILRYKDENQIYLIKLSKPCLVEKK